MLIYFLLTLWYQDEVTPYGENCPFNIIDVIKSVTED